MTATASTAQIELLPQDTGLRPGAIIEVLAYTTLRGEQHWQRYEVMDWETPRLDEQGRCLFTARGVDHGYGPCPMHVESNRIRIVAAPKSQS